MTVLNTPSSVRRSRPLVALRVVAGLGLLIIGCLLALPGIPGPGIALALLGLLLLRDHFAWARKSLAWLKRRVVTLRRRLRGAGSRNGRR